LKWRKTPFAAEKNIGAGFHHYLIGFPAVSFSGGIHLNVGFKVITPVKTKEETVGSQHLMENNGGFQPSKYGFVSYNFPVLMAFTSNFLHLISHPSIKLTHSHFGALREISAFSPFWL